MESYRRLLLNNKAWAMEKLSLSKSFFRDRAIIENAEFLWIGCSDSRVPPDDIIGTQPGEIYAHRNVANLVIETDLNFLSVLQYAVEILKVKHVIVCGHSNCGALEMAINGIDKEPLRSWLGELKDTFATNEVILNSILDKEEKSRKIAELNVEAQVKKLANIDIVKNSWLINKKPTLHGWIYNVQTGLLDDLILISAE